MSIAGSVRLASLRGPRSLAALLALAGLTFASPLFAEGPSVTNLVVRFRDAAPAADYATAPTPAQFEILGKSLRTGIAASTPTIDGGFRLTLAPSMAFQAAREAVTRLRMSEDVLYASIAATDAPTPALNVREKRDSSSPPLHRLIIRYREPRLAADAAADRALDAAQLDALGAIAGQPVAHERTMSWARAYVVRLFQPLPVEDIEAIAARIAQQPDVLWAQPDYIDTIHVTPNDPLYNMPPGSVQWHYFEATGGANLPTAWDRTRGWSGLRTAVVDTGALFGHPDLGSRFLGGYDFIISFQNVASNDGDDRDPDASDPGDWVFQNQCGVNNAQNSSWHGTHVAGTIGALTNNASGVAGINHVSRIVPVRVLGMCGGFSSDIADGMFWASGGAVSGVPANMYPARVVNMSLGGRRANQLCDSIYQTTITSMLGNNSVVVVSAGNNNEDAAFATPANCDGVITVAATGRAGQRASYSNFDVSTGTPQVEIAAPGGSFADGELAILSTLNSGTTVPAAHNFVQYQGTSMAAPHVTGIASLMLSLKPSLTPAQVLAIMTSTARSFPTGTGRNCTNNIALATGPTRYCGAGIVDASAALTNIMNTGNGGNPMAAASATLSSSANPATIGTPVTFTAQITGNAPVGNVGFVDDETAIAGCAAVALPNSGGNTRSAQCTTSSLALADHPIRAVFTPSNDANTPADSPTLVQVVNPGTPVASTTQLATSLNPAAQGVSVTLTATVTGYKPGGSVQFTSNGAPILGCTNVGLSGSGNTRIAQCTTNALAVGMVAIQANYSGDAFNLPSSGTLRQGVSGPNACTVFNDVTSASPFCSNVAWIFNRIITLGCESANYCPDLSVSRLGMAAFMNREGTALTPVDLNVATTDVANVNLSSPVIVCQTADYAVANFPRRAFMRARSNLWGPSGNMEVSAQHVYSTNGGSSWTPAVGVATFDTLYGGRSPAEDRTTTPFGELDLAVGTTYRFGLRLTRTAGAGNVVGVYCANFVQLGNRNASAPPL